MNRFEQDKEQNRDKWWNRLIIDYRFYYPTVYIIDWFFDEYRFLSNYHLQPIIYDGKLYQTTEAAYQAAKTTLFEAKEDIRLASSPGKAKKLGGCVPIRPDWEEIKEQVMREVVWLKFNADPTLTRNLLNTGDSYLIESTTWHDNCWGICVKKDCVKCSGKLATNLLGKILMETRKKLKEQEDLIKEYNMNLGIETIGWA
jgi:ribA/ribD-fused uncharacterized protein